MRASPSIADSLLVCRGKCTADCSLRATKSPPSHFSRSSDSSSTPRLQLLRPNQRVPLSSPLLPSSVQPCRRTHSTRGCAIWQPRHSLSSLPVRQQVSETLPFREKTSSLTSLRRFLWSRLVPRTFLARKAVQRRRSSREKFTNRFSRDAWPVFRCKGARKLISFD